MRMPMNGPSAVFVVAADPNRPIDTVTGAKKNYKRTVPLFEPGHETVRAYRDNIRKAHESLNDITHSNTTMNRELINGLGMQYEMQMFDPHAKPTACHMDVAIVDALAEYYGVLREGEKKRLGPRLGAVKSIRSNSVSVLCEDKE